MATIEQLAAAVDRLRRVRDGGENVIGVYETALPPPGHQGPWGPFEKLRLALERFQDDKETLANGFIDRVFTDAQCYVLNAGQHDRKRHPYTCGNNSRHRPLIATPAGWKCADCDYRQDWAHDADKQGPPEVAG